MSVRAIRVTVTGAVQGVGYRAWVENEATRRGLAGWIRNRRDGSVEAVFSGEPGAVDGMLAACAVGPLGGEVTAVAVADYAGPPLSRFTVLPTG